MVASEPPSDDRKTWLYAFMILLLVSLWMLSMRLLNIPLLLPDFEVVIIYVPTILAGIILLLYSRPKRVN